MLYLIGLGLGDFEDVTVKGLKAIRSSDKVYLEAYTSVLTDSTKDQLEEVYKKEVVLADREFVEIHCDRMLEEARHETVSFLVVGDPFGATTHTDLFLRAREKGVEVKVIHNASIMNAMGCSGLQLYRFGQTVSAVFFETNWRPYSFVHKIAENYKMGLHTLVLLDIKVKEQTVQNMMKGNKIYEPPRFMTVNQACEEICEAIENDSGLCAPLTYSAKVVGLARVGSDSQFVGSGTLQSLQSVDFGRPLHSLIVCAPELHEIEQQFYKLFYADAGKALELESREKAAEAEPTQPAESEMESESDDDLGGEDYGKDYNDEDREDEFGDGDEGGGDDY